MTTKGKVLIIDDDPDFVEVVRTALETDDFEVFSAADGSQGLALMRQEKPDLVFLDVIMVLPDEGVTVSEEMARDADLRDIPVVMVSSVAQSEYTGYFPTDRPLHVDLFLDKPVSLQKLLDIANDYVRQQEASV